MALSLSRMLAWIANLSFDQHMFTTAWTIEWHSSTGIKGMGRMDNNNFHIHGYHRQVFSSCFTWIRYCVKVKTKVFNWSHPLVEKPFSITDLMKLPLQFTVSFLSSSSLSSPLLPSLSIFLSSPPPSCSFLSPSPSSPFSFLFSFSSSPSFSPSLPFPPLPSLIGYRHAAILRQGWQWRCGWSRYGLQSGCWPYPHPHCCNNRWRKARCHWTRVGGTHIIHVWQSVSLSPSSHSLRLKAVNNSVTVCRDCFCRFPRAVLTDIDQITLHYEEESAHEEIGKQNVATRAPQLRTTIWQLSII